MNPTARVLLVDDDESLLETTAALLEDDFSIEKARSGFEALALLKKHSFEVMCTDLQMPGMDGLDLLRKVAAQHPNVSGVLITGHKDYLSDRRVHEGLAFTVLLKPFGTNELIHEVQRAVQRARIKTMLDGRERRRR